MYVGNIPFITSSVAFGLNKFHLMQRKVNLMRNFIFMLGAVILFSCSNPKNVSSLLSENSDVKLNTKIVSDLKKHKPDTFKLNLQGKSFVYGYADQLSLDVMVEVYNEDKKQIAFFDNPARGPEYFQFKTEKPGIYKLVIVPFKENEGKYSLLLTNAEPLATEPEKQIDQIVNASLHLSDGKIAPGVSIGVMQNGKMVYNKGFGYADIESEEKVTPKTIFHVASVSKQFTAFSIALLVDQGKLSLKDDIRKYLPEIYDFGKTITIDHLIHHTSGLRDQWNLLAMAGWRLDDVITKKQILRLISKQRELNFNPGDEMVYCNTGYTLLAEIVSRVSGKSFADWTQENIFQPIGMKNTLFYDDHEKIVMGRAYSYQPNPTGFKKSVLSYANAGATSLFTTPEDLSLWAMNFETMKVGSPRVMAMMDQRFILSKGDTISYAFAQDIGKYKSLNTRAHSGGDAGFRSFLLRFPDQHFSVSVFSNTASFNPGSLSYAIADLYLKDQLKEEKPKAEQGPPAPEEKKIPFDASKIKLAEFVGTFYSPELETAYTFAVENDTLWTHHQRHDDMKLTPLRQDVFQTSAWYLGEVEFLRNKANQITGLRASNGRVRGVKFEKK
jgi:CubicO group peptidase (beta-lactamase class C family)